MAKASPSTPRLARTTFKTSRLLDFCSEKELTAQVGHGRWEWPLVVVKELLDNALDASEEAGIAPTIAVDITPTSITVTDNGPGMPVSTLEGVLDFAVRTSSREAYVSPTRGAQGNALKTIVAMPYVLDGAQGRVEITTAGVRHVIALDVDRIRQMPVVSRTPEPADVKPGTSITVRWPDSASSELGHHRIGFLQLAQAYACLNPHLTLTLTTPWGEASVEATAPTWTKFGPSDPTDPHWYDAVSFSRLIGAYLSTPEGDRRSVREFVAEFRGLSGSIKPKAVVETAGLQRCTLAALANGLDLDAAKVQTLLTAMQQAVTPVKPAALGVIGESHLRTRLAWKIHER
jgi:DNA topoisomerase VI subunit B